MNPEHALKCIRKAMQHVHNYRCSVCVEQGKLLREAERNLEPRVLKDSKSEEIIEVFLEEESEA